MTARPELGSWQDWARQQLVFTEAVRGGPLVWPVGSEHLAGDPLGPVRHAHDDAAEYYFVLSGECLVEVGGDERVATTNDLVFIPANAPHNLLGEVGGEDAWVFVLVAPNFAHNKWRTSDFLPGTEDLRMTISRPLEDDSTARSHPFRASVERFGRDEPKLIVSDTAELVYLVVDGRVHTRVGFLSGALGPGDYAHVRRDVDHEFSSLTDESTVLRFDCEFLPFGGVDLGPGREKYSG
jgi:quercetin dioxygenase-like cupin family protein